MANAPTSSIPPQTGPAPDPIFDGARYLASLPVQLVGVDYLSVGGYTTDGIETHQALLTAGIWIVEGLNLADVRPGIYELFCLPLKIADSDGAPARAVLRAWDS